MPGNNSKKGKGPLSMNIIESFRYAKDKDKPNTSFDRASTSSNGASLFATGDCSGTSTRTPERDPSTGDPETPEHLLNPSKNTNSSERNGHVAVIDSQSEGETPLPIKSRMKRIVFKDSDSDSDVESSTRKRFKPAEVAVERPRYPVSDVDIFSAKELGLKVLIRTFPKMDLMEVSTVLAKCNWNSEKAVHVIKDKCNPERCDHVLTPEPEPKKEEKPRKKHLIKLKVRTAQPATVSAPLETIAPTNSQDEKLPDSQATLFDSQISVTPVLTPDSESEPPTLLDIIDNGSASAHTEVAADGSQSSASTHTAVATDGSQSSDYDINKVARQVTRQKHHELSSDEDSDDGKVKFISMASVKPSASKPVVRNRIHDMSSDEENEKASSQPGSEKADSKPPSPKPVESQKKKKRKRKDVGRCSDDEEDFARDELYDSEDSDIDETLTPAREAVLKFFQSATNPELITVPGCSKKKADIVINFRPIYSWRDLVEKLQRSKNLSTDMLKAAQDVIVMREVMNKLMQKCEKIASDMEKVAAQINTGASKGRFIKKQPETLTNSMQMAPYQMLGLNWLWVMHCRRLNGILADEMGLGKTIQAIAFLAHLREQEGTSKHLVIVPSSTLDNWLRELQIWCPSFEVVTYHGSQDTRRELRLQLVNEEIEDFDVMVTTYNMVSGSPEDRTLFRRLSFHYVIFDEAHMLKNMNSQRYQNLMKIRADRRLLLTGTPLQNNLVELMSLLIFVMPDMFYGKIEQVKQMFASACKSEENRSNYEKERIEHAKRIMKPFVLRRLKSEVLTQLPTKHEEILQCYSTPSQKKMYSNLVTTFSKKMNEKLDVKTSGIGMMMELRKAANHPLLIRNKFSDKILRKIAKALLNEPNYVEANPDLIFEDMQVMSDFELHKLCLNFKSISSYKLDEDAILDSGKFRALDNLLPELKENGSRFLLFSQFTMMLDIVEAYFAIRKYTYVRLDGSTPVPERQALMDKFNENDEIFAFLLSTRAGGLGINLTAANTVLLHDIDFNPYNDKQAEDRCHRMGQTREVTVKKLIMQDTIEEAILKCANDKLKLEKDITSNTEEDNEEEVKTVSNLLKTALGL